MSNNPKTPNPPKWVMHTLLDDLGFGMAELATAIGYPHAALRAFRSGALKEQDKVTYDGILAKLADIAVMTSRIGRHRGKTGGGTDEAALFGIKLVDGYTAAGWDLYAYPDGHRCAAASRGDLTPRRTDESGEAYVPGHTGLCELAEGVPAEQVLDRYTPDWRTRFWTDYEVSLASDGYMSIRPKPRSGA